MKQPIDRKFRKKLLLPLYIVVAITLLTWRTVGFSFGEPDAPFTGGINTTLPPAHLKEDKGLNKLSFYQKADQDSQRLREKIKNQQLLLPNNKLLSQPLPNPNEEKIDQQLARLKVTLGQAPGSLSPGIPRTTVSPLPHPNPGFTSPPPIAATDVDRLERLLKTMKDGGPGNNPEMKELNTTLDKLIAVQHPTPLPDTTGKRPALPPLPVIPAAAGETVTTWNSPTIKTNRWYDLESSESDPETPPAGILISASIPETQTLVNGALVKLELITDLTIKGNHIPKGTPLYGIAQLTNERLAIIIKAIHYKENVYPVALQVIDQDGLPGIYEPGSMTRDITRESAGQSIMSVGPSSFDPSLSGQATSAGLQLARSLTSKKIRLVRVTVKAGYRVFLADISQK